MENNDEHLTLAQIEAIARGESSDLLRKHLDICAVCRTVVAEEQDWSAKVRLLRAGDLPQFDEGCPNAEELAVTAGNPKAPEAEKILKHAASCDRCGTILGETLVAASDTNPTVFSLRSASPAWQMVMARRLADAGKRSKERSRARWPQWLAAAACILAMAGAALWWRARQMSDPAKMLAVAYTAARPFEYRLPDAGYSPVRQQRNSLHSAFDRPESLVDAEMEIQRRLKTNPGAAQLLSLKGRAELIESEFDSAIEDLRRAAHLNPSAEVLVDLGAALSLRENAARKPDYGEAIDDFLRALRIDPRNVDALFNLAIDYEKVGMLDESAAAWNRFLGIEKGTAWREEARRRLAEVEERKKAKKTALERVPDDPKALIAAARSGQEFDAEFLQNAFWTKWLPAAFQDPASDEAARIVADAWKERFGDPSLREAYGQARSGAGNLPADVGAVIAANIHGQNDDVLFRGEDLVRKLKAAEERVAAIRMQLELAYSYRRSERHEPCLAITNKLLGKLEGSSYWWLLGKTHLEHSICVGRAGGMGPARQERQRAAAELTAQGLNGLALQAQELVTSIDALSGNSPQCGRHHRPHSPDIGLPPPPMRKHSRPFMIWR